MQNLFAMKVGVEAVRGLPCKFWMMGVEILGPTCVYGENMSVIHNTQHLDSMLKKKSDSVCHCVIRESVAMEGGHRTCEHP